MAYRLVFTLHLVLALARDLHRIAELRPRVLALELLVHLRHKARPLGPLLRTPAHVILAGVLTGIVAGRARCLTGCHLFLPITAKIFSSEPDPGPL